MKYIDSLKDYDELVEVMQDNEVIILHTFVNHKIHYIRNNPSLFYIRIWNTMEEYVIGIDHPDLFNIPIERLDELKPKTVWTIDKKRLRRFLTCDLKDVDMLNYLNTNTSVEWSWDTPNSRIYHQKYKNRTDVNKLIPATKHIQIHQINAEKITYILQNVPVSNAYEIYGTFLDIIFELETAGIKIDSNLMKQFYDNDDHISPENFMYSEYNFYTSAGRPSNRFGNFNFAAIDKSSGIRRAIIPRNDDLMLFDFDSFHLNLIAKIIGYKFEADNIHTYMGQYYFGKTELTSEEYDESKTKNFRYLYGGIPRYERENIPYFAAVHEFTFVMWRQIKRVGYYESPLTGRRIRLKHIDNPTPMKVLNYFIQLLETETNIILIDKIQKYLKDYKTKLILYTYDSFLFDHSKEDGKECILGIKKILDVFPTKAYFGYDYHDLVEITDILANKL